MGLAEVYQGSGAVYGPKGKEEYLTIEKEAKQNKVVIWSQKNRESLQSTKREQSRMLLRCDMDIS